MVLRISVLSVPVLVAVLAVMAGCAVPQGNPADPGNPGATGTTIVPGSTSTVTGDAGATVIQQRTPQGERR
jgi:hypothetical protein